MKKEEIIRKAWLELNYEPDKTDNNGYVDYYSLPEDFDVCCLDALLGDMSENPRKIMVRPKSLNGLEDNNGWIKIESEADLPNEVIECEICSDNVPCDRTFTYFPGTKDFRRSAINFPKPVTHYRIFEVKHAPIY